VEDLGFFRIIDFVLSEASGSPRSNLRSDRGGDAAVAAVLTPMIGPDTLEENPLGDIFRNLRAYMMAQRCDDNVK